MAKPVILFLVNPTAMLEWKKRESQYPSVEAISSPDGNQFPWASQFCKVTIIVYDDEWCRSKYIWWEGGIKQFCEGLLRLKWIHIWSGGFDQVLTFLKTLPPTVRITNNKGAYSASIAEYVMGVILHFEKNILQLVENKEKRNYARCGMSCLEGKTIGILGYGDIGSAIARRAKNAFDMRVVAVKRQEPSGSPPDCVDKLIILNNVETRASLQVFKEADYVVNTLPATSDTGYYCSGREFKAMKQSAVFINVGSGATVDETALIQALNTGRIRGAALDKFQSSTLSEKSAWWNIDNLLISNHHPDVTQTSVKRGMDVFVKNLKSFMENGSVETPIDVLYEY